MFFNCLRDSVIHYICCDKFIMDLGFKLTSNLDQSPHIESICCETFKKLEFIMRLAKDLRLKSSLKVLYITFIQPILKYGSPIWDPHTVHNACQLERIHRRFFRFANYFLAIDCPHDYYTVASCIGLVPLADHSLIYENKFLKCPVSGVVILQPYFPN